jgi:hypothetical protein
MRLSFVGNDRAVDETTHLLQPSTIAPRSYFTYKDLAHRALGSLKLISVEAPQESSWENIKINSIIHLPVICFFEVTSFMDKRSYESLSCTNKRMRAALLMCQSRDAISGMPMVRIDPSSLMNRLRGIKHAPVDSLDDLERNASNDSSDGDISVGAFDSVPFLPRLWPALPFVLLSTVVCILAIVFFSEVINLYVNVHHLLVLSTGICLIIILYMLMIWQRLRNDNPFIVFE